MVNRSQEIHTPPGRQVSAMGRGGGHGRGTGRGGSDGSDGRDGRDRRGRRGYDSGRGNGGCGNDRGRRSDCIPSTTTFRPENCPNQDAVDCAKLSIVNLYVTGDRIFVGDHVYNTELNATERHAVFHIRANLKDHKNPLGGASRKRTSEVAALQRTVRELIVHVGHYPDDHTEDNRGRGQYPEKLTAAPTRISLDLFASLTLRRNRKALEIDMT